MSSYRRAPRHLALTLEQHRRQWAPAGLLAEVQARWGEAVGEAIAAQCTPVSERGGTLTIACAGSVWAQELDLISPMVIERLNGLLQGGAVRRLRCLSTPPPGLHNAVERSRW